MTTPRSTARTTLARACRVLIVVLVAISQGGDLLDAGPGFSPTEYYSYFTILSNLFAAVVAAWGLIGRAPAVVRGAALTALLLTFVVVLALLGGIEIGRDSFGTIMQHGATPVLALADWLLDPPRRRLRVSAVWWWTLIPLAYLAYSLVRGAILDWYPYDFLDVAANGYGSVAVTSAFVAVAFIAMSFAVRWVGNRLSPAR